MNGREWALFLFRLEEPENCCLGDAVCRVASISVMIFRRSTRNLTKHLVKACRRRESSPNILLPD